MYVAKQIIELSILDTEILVNTIKKRKHNPRKFSKFKT